MGGVLFKGGKEPGVSDHKGHFFGCDGFSRDDEVAFVLAVGGIEDDDEFSIACDEVLWVSVELVMTRVLLSKRPF